MANLEPAAVDHADLAIAAADPAMVVVGMTGAGRRRRISSRARARTRAGGRILADLAMVTAGMTGAGSGGGDNGEQDGAHWAWPSPARLGFFFSKTIYIGRQQVQFY